MSRATEATTAELAAERRRESDRFRRGEPHGDDFAFELFRRAICERDELAWYAIVAEYIAVVRAWVRQHPAAGRLPADDDLVSGTFARFWVAVGPERWSQFPNLASLLRYLKLCAHSLVVDHVRA